MKIKRLTCLTTVLSLALCGPLLAQEPTLQLESPATENEGQAEVIAAGTLTAVVRDSVTFDILTKALKASGLDVTLAGDGPFTIFAPTDEAFGKLPAGTLDKLLLPENKEKLRSLLLYHVVAGKVMAADLKDDEKVTTMNGEKIEFDIDDQGKDVEINDDVKVFSTDVSATNGVMHSIGEVLVPKSLDGFAGLKS